ncbi:hypothetical protein T439DRAFT_357785 [Meredithblackwellia eburnea MCA 4105]
MLFKPITALVLALYVRLVSSSPSSNTEVEGSMVTAKRHQRMIKGKKDLESILGELNNALGLSKSGTGRNTGNMGISRMTAWKRDSEVVAEAANNNLMVKRDPNARAVSKRDDDKADEAYNIDLVTK